MKKFLSFLSSFALVSSALTSLTSCNNNSINPIPPKPDVNPFEKLNLDVFNNNLYNLKNIIGNKTDTIKGLTTQIKSDILNYFKNNKSAIYNKYSKKVNDAINNDLSILIFDSLKSSQPLSKTTKTKPYTNYYVSIKTKKSNYFFENSNNKNNESVLLSEIDFHSIVNSLTKNFKNSTPNAIISNLKDQIQNQYIKQTDSKTSVDIVDDSKIKITQITSKENTNSKLNFNVNIDANDKYFLPTSVNIDNVQLDNGQDLNNFKLSKIASADNGQNLYDKIFQELNDQFSNKINFAADSNLSVNIIQANSKKPITKESSLHDIYQPLILNMTTNAKETYFLPNQTFSQKFQLTTININDYQKVHQNWNFNNANTCLNIAKNVAISLAKYYNTIIDKQISYQDILNNNYINILIYDVNTNLYLKKDSQINFDHKYKIFINFLDNNSYFSSENHYLFDSFLLVDSNLNNINFNNIKSLSSSYQLYEDVYSNLLHYYHLNISRKTKLNPSINDLMNDKKINVKIFDSNQKLLVYSDETNNLKIKTNYSVKISVSKNDLYFQATNQLIVKTINIAKLQNIELNLFTYLNFPFNKIDQSLITQTYKYLLQDYNNSSSVKITINDLIKDSNLKLNFKYQNASKFLLPGNSIDFNKILVISLSIQKHDQYFSAQNIVLKTINFNNSRYLLSDLNSAFANLRYSLNDQLNAFSIQDTILNFVNQYKSKKINWNQLINNNPSSLSFTFKQLPSTTFPKYSVTLIVKNNLYFKDGSQTYNVVFTQSSTYDINSNYIDSVSRLTTLDHDKTQTFADLRNFSIYAELAFKYNNKFHVTSYLDRFQIANDSKIKISIQNSTGTKSYSDNMEIPHVEQASYYVYITVAKNDQFFTPLNNALLFHITFYYII